MDADIAVSLDAEGAGLKLSEDRCRLTLQWHLAVPAHGEVSVRWQLGMQDTREFVLPATLPISVPNLASRSNRVDHRLWPWLTSSVEDLRALWMATRDAPQDGFFAAGAPWYFALFGRDSIWTARMLLPVSTEPARRTAHLARRQGRRVDVEAAEEPGKFCTNSGAIHTASVQCRCRRSTTARSTRRRWDLPAARCLAGWCSER